MKNIAILGSTGSVGTNALDVIRNFPENFRVVGLTANSNIGLLEKQIYEFKPLAVAVADEKRAEELQKRTNVQVFSGKDGLKRIASLPESDFLITAVMGFSGLVPTLAAINAGKAIGLANKETLVAGGSLVMKEAKRRDVKIIPVDSEHSAIFQCMEGNKFQEARRILLTASGGPFLNLKKEELENVTLHQALKHPTWKMGRKITIDSATLMNKGFEVIEAYHLFGMDYSKIDVVVHPQSIIHSMVEFVDGSIIAQMSFNDMRLPIQFALTYPDRIKSELKLDLTKCTLTFKSPDREFFPCLGYAYEAGIIGGTMPCVMNAANEIAVDFFLNEKIRFLDIPRAIRAVMDAHKPLSNPDIDEILAADDWARKEAVKILQK